MQHHPSLASLSRVTLLLKATAPAVTEPAKSPGCASPESPTSEDDRDIRRAVAGDREAFDRLVLRHQQAVLNSAYYYLGDYQDALEVETVPLITRFSIGLTDPVGEGAFYRGNVDLCLEGIFLVNTEPHSGSAQGAALGFRWNFLAPDRVVPYVGIGTGILNLDYDLETQRDGFNFFLIAEFGTQVLLNARTAVAASYRFQHISNADIGVPNLAVDTSFVVIGFTYFLQ